MEGLKRRLVLEVVTAYLENKGLTVNDIPTTRRGVINLFYQAYSFARKEVSLWRLTMIIDVHLTMEDIVKAIEERRIDEQ